MAIINKEERYEKKVIDLTGPQGNAFFLLRQAEVWAKQMGLDFEKIHKEMTGGDYENLIQVFDKYFGSICDLER